MPPPISSHRLENIQNEKKLIRRNQNIQDDVVVDGDDEEKKNIKFVHTFMGKTTIIYHLLLTILFDCVYFATVHVRYTPT